MSAEEARASVRAEVEHLRNLGRPRLSADRGRLAFEYRPPAAATLGGGAFTTAMSVGDVMAKPAWLAPAIVEDALLGEVEGMDLTGAMSADEREHRRDELRAALDAAERAEEQLIEGAGQQGQNIPRRPDASPLAVLQIRIAGAQEMAAA